MTLYFKFFLFFFIITELLAGKGVVLVLEAPLLIAPDKNATIVQYVRKGDIIYVNYEHFRDGQAPPLPPSENPTLDEIYSSFYKSIDRNGNTVYIPQQYVKLIYKDEREFDSNVSPFKYDPTDYRIIEPISDTYPFIPPNDYRIIAGVGVGSPRKFNYDYLTEIMSQNYGFEFGGTAAMLQNINLDETGRFYFGGKGTLKMVRSEIIFDQEFSDASETKYEVIVSPTISYDVFRSNKLLLTLYGGPFIGFNQITISLNGTDLSEDRTFSGYFFGATIGSYIQFLNTIEKDFSFILGGDAFINAPYTLISGSEGESEDWNYENDVISNGFDASFQIYLGFIVRTR
ncbi:MAG: hypothetical protein H6622_01455 [Halobacteriovoraceae bacterium]|nr:hypothetical protein [Halobacteriovoraceae bacterium]